MLTTSEQRQRLTASVACRHMWKSSCSDCLYLHYHNSFKQQNIGLVKAAEGPDYCNNMEGKPGVGGGWNAYTYKNVAWKKKRLILSWVKRN